MVALAVLLGAPGQSLAGLVRNCTHEWALRRFACACAEFALASCDLNLAVLPQALRAVAESPDLVHGDLDLLQNAVKQVVLDLDMIAWDLQEALWKGADTGEAYDIAHRRARAAESVLACLNVSATDAAAEACIQAFWVTNNADRLLMIGQNILR